MYFKLYFEHEMLCVCERERERKFDHKCLFQSSYNIYFELVNIKKLVNIFYQKVQMVQTYMSLN
jgi:hypothetical protein